MSFNLLVRRTHRVLAIAFTVTVLASLVALTQPELLAWVFYLPLLPIVLLMLSGLYLFALPYARRSRNAETQSRG